MVFLVVGLGSMGKRRIRNLQYLGCSDIIGFDPREDRRKEAEKTYNIKTVSSFDEGLKEKPIAVIISTPPNYHIQYAKEAAKMNINFFMEVTVSEGMQELVDICKNKSI